tara:strand:- start:528 stop:779 length:252 start_codon:yes stop_codon:yes gene_type:complete
MGEARRRGSREERAQQSRQRTAVHRTEADNLGNQLKAHRFYHQTDQRSKRMIENARTYGDVNAMRGYLATMDTLADRQDKANK